MILEIELNDEKYNLDTEDINNTIKMYKDEGSDDDWWGVVHDGKLDINITDPKVYGGDTELELNYAIYHVDNEGTTDHSCYITMEKINEMISEKRKNEVKVEVKAESKNKSKTRRRP